MGFIKVSNVVYGFKMGDMIVPGGIKERKTTKGDLANIKFSELDKGGRSL